MRKAVQIGLIFIENKGIMNLYLQAGLFAVGKRGMMSLQQNKMTALYTRLSRDDDFQGDSMSIQTQKSMLSQYAEQNGFKETVFYVDDGFSGTSFERPDFQRMLSDIEDGKIGTVITKDLSRLGRDYLKTGFYTECYFPENHVRYIAVNDNVDTAKGDNEFAPFRNIMNEWYARDVSKKIKSAYRTKAQKGEFTGPYAPYGYRKSPEDKHKLIIDEETAPIVKRIFELAASGVSPFRITTILKKDGILKPRAYTMETAGKYVSAKNVKYPYDWGNQTIIQMLRNRVYLGHMVNNKSTTQSFKSKKLVALPEEQWIEVKNTHEPIVDEHTFMLAQKAAQVKRRPNHKGESQIFAGLLKCGDCGKALSYAKRQNRSYTGSYACNTFRRYGKSYCSMHYVTYEALYDIVLGDINKQAKMAHLEPDNLLEQIAQMNNIKNKRQMAQAEKEILRTEKRFAELDVIIKRLYEDNVLGKLTDERFMVLSREYEDEQKQIKESIVSLKTQVTAFSDTQESSERFAKVVQKYCDIKELDAVILNELIDKIVIHECEYVNGERTQKIDIYYNFVGLLQM